MSATDAGRRTRGAARSSRARPPAPSVQLPENARSVLPPVPPGWRIGIGIITCRRPRIAAETALAVRRFTRAPFELVIADDGSPPGMVDELAAEAPVITGLNRGVTWNKNRALFHLHAVRRCDVVILLEDDTRPTAAGWERVWVEAGRRYGHANLAGDWFRHTFLRGQGTPDDPYLSRDFSGQCTVFSPQALNFAGYLDTRYRGFGIGHVDHTHRMARAGFGAQADPTHGMLFFLLQSALTIVPTESARKEEDVQRNHALYQTLSHEGIYRAPWSTDDELRALRAELEAIRAE